MNERPDPLAEPEGYGSRVPDSLKHLVVGHGRVAEVGPSMNATLGAGVTPGVNPTGGNDDELCSWYTPPSGDRCGEEREWQLIAGDRAEHVCHLDLCDKHLHVVASQPRFWCTQCRQDMRLEKVGAVVDGEIVWLDETGWPGRLRRPAAPPEKLF